MTEATDIRRFGAAYAKWGDALNAGFQLVPDILLKHQDRLGLNANDLVVLLNVLMHWWYAEKLPFPRTTLIAGRMGVGQRTVQRSLKRLEELALIERVKGPERNSVTQFNPSGLVRRLIPLAHEDIGYRDRLTAQEPPAMVKEEIRQ